MNNIKRILKNRAPMIILTGFFIVYVTLPFLAPIFMYFGLEKPADIIYKIYSFLCHQRAERSMFLFSTHIFYSLSELKAFGANTLPQLREFIGDPEIGYKLAFCFRDLGIYSSLSLIGILNVLSKRKFKALNWKIVLLASLPMAFDGGLQFIAELMFYSGWHPFGLSVGNSPFYVSDNFRRIFTGSIFGTAIGMWLYPSIQKEFSR